MKKSLEEKLKRLVNTYDKYYDDPYKICIENNINLEDYYFVSFPSVVITYIPVDFISLENNKNFTIVYMPYKNYINEEIFLENNINKKIIFSYRKSLPLTIIINTVLDRLLYKPSHKNIEYKIIREFSDGYLDNFRLIFNRYNFIKDKINRIEKRSLIRSIEKKYLCKDVTGHVMKYLSFRDIIKREEIKNYLYIK